MRRLSGFEAAMAVAIAFAVVYVIVANFHQLRAKKAIMAAVARMEAVADQNDLAVLGAACAGPSVECLVANDGWRVKVMYMTGSGADRHEYATQWFAIKRTPTLRALEPIVYR
jgi:hypothetical protein